MKKISAINVACVCLAILAFSTAQAPGGEDFPACSRRDPQLGECIFNSIHKLKPLFASGKLSPELMIDPLDPFFLHSVTFGGPSSLTKVTFSDIYISGATDFRLKEIKASYADGYLKVMPRVELDRIDVRCKYYIHAWPVSQLGVIEMSLLDVKVHGDARVRLYTRNGGEYAKVEQAKLTFDSIKAGNLRYSVPWKFDEVRDAGPVLRGVLERFSEPLMKTLYRLLERRIDEVHINVVNEFIKDVPASYFLSE